VSPRFAPGDRVRVQSWYPPGHVRTPFYARGRIGLVQSLAAVHPNPEDMAYGRTAGPPDPVYRVRFAQTELWPAYARAPDDATVIDLQESWLEPAP
jgi:nitrile hydratase